ncbi:MAG: Crp/Fnr family transcriptional regulator [Anaerolineae bacterium]
MPEATSPLSQIKVFAETPASALAELEALAQPFTVDDGQIILVEGNTDTRVFFVLSGKVRVFRTNADGREQTLALLQHGDIFNLPTVFATGNIAPAMAVAIGPAQLLVINGDEFRQVAIQNPEIALALLRALSNKLHHFTLLTHDLSLHSVRTRLARFLLDYMADDSAPAIRWTQEDIAAQVGTVREVVSRTLRAFAKEGLITLRRQHITLLDIDGLRKEASQ